MSFAMLITNKRLSKFNLYSGSLSKTLRFMEFLVRVTDYLALVSTTWTADTFCLCAIGLCTVSHVSIGMIFFTRFAVEFTVETL